MPSSDTHASCAYFLTHCLTFHTHLIRPGTARLSILTAIHRGGR